MEPALRGIIGVHGGRMYYNLTSIHAVLRMAPCGDRLTQAFNRFVGADDVAAPPPGAAQWGDGRGRVGRSVELLRVAASTTWQYLWLRRRLEAFEARADRFASRTRPVRLAERPLPGLLEEPAVLSRHPLPSLEGRLSRRRGGDWSATRCCNGRSGASTRAAALHNRLLRALPGVPSTMPPLRLWHLSRLIRSDARLDRLFRTAETPAILHALGDDDRFVRFRQAFDRFLDDWGFRSSAELMLTAPSLQEDPAPAIELLKQYAASDGEPPAAAMARQAAERVAETVTGPRGAGAPIAGRRAGGQDPVALDAEQRGVPRTGTG